MFSVSCKFLTKSHQKRGWNTKYFSQTVFSRRVFTGLERESAPILHGIHLGKVQAVGPVHILVGGLLWFTKESVYNVLSWVKYLYNKVLGAS